MEIDLTEFIPLKNYEDYYLIHKDGRIYSKRYENLLSKYENKIGKMYVGLTVQGKRQRFSIDALLSVAFPNQAIKQAKKWQVISQKTRSIFRKSDITTQVNSDIKWKPL